MEPERWAKVKDIVTACLEIQPAYRGAFIFAACGGNQALQAEVETLLASCEQAGSFLGTGHQVLEKLESLLPTSSVVNDPLREVSGGGPTALLPGQTLHHYRVLKKIGAGGMGEVYCAHDEHLEREVALKILPMGFAVDESVRRRFRQEALTLSRLNHPNIATVFDFDTQDQVAFIVLELIRGTSVNQQVKLAALNEPEIIRLGMQLADGLAAAHAQGVIHRDLKPANLMITVDGRLKILDFGLAVLEGPEGEPELTHMTAEALAIRGTLPYMSPEQLRGQQVDARSDIYAAGAVLYEMATGQRVFPQPQPAELIGAILHRSPVPLRTLNPRVSHGLEHIVMKSLEKEPERRYQSARELLTALEQLAVRKSIRGGLTGLASALPIGPKLKVRLALALTAPVALAVALSVYYILALREAEPFQTMSMERLTSAGEVRVAAISPDGKYLAFAAGARNKPSFWVRQLATKSDLQILPPEPGAFEGITFSRDTNYIYYVRHQDGGAAQLFRVATFGGTPRRILSGADSPVALSPDGNSVAFLRNTGAETQALMVAGIDETTEKVLTQRTAPDGFAGYGVSWSPDGKLIATAAYSAGRCYVMVSPAHGGRLQPIGAHSWLHVRQLVWLPDSSGLILIALRSHSSPGQIWHISFPRGTARRITNDLNDYGDLSLTADSRTLVAVQGDITSNLWRVPDGQASRAAQITFGTGAQDGVYGLDATRGDRVVLASFSGGSRELWMMGNGASPRQLTTDADITYFATPSFCPDAHTIVYGAGPYGKALIWRLDSETEKPRALISSGTHGGPSCSPDGQWVYYNTLGSFYDIWRIPLRGGTPEQLTRFPSTYPHISPDGRWVAYLAPAPNRSAVGVIPATGGPPARTVDLSRSRIAGEEVIRWSPSGEAIDYVDTRNGVSNIWRQPLRGGPPQALTSFQSGLIFNFVWLPGGRDMIVARGSTTSDAVRIRNAGGWR